MVAIAVSIGVIIDRFVFDVWIKLLGVFCDAAECLSRCRSTVP
jgi:hypothetical protein